MSLIPNLPFINLFITRFCSFYIFTILFFLLILWDFYENILKSKFSRTLILHNASAPGGHYARIVHHGNFVHSVILISMQNHQSLRSTNT